MKYQNEEAWVWESQAIVRARAIVGDADIREKIDAELTVLRNAERDPAKVTKEILSMRKTLDKEKPAANLFDVKLVEGGLIDIEFIAQWAVLTKAAVPSDDYDSSTISLIEAVDDAVLDTGRKEQLKNAYQFYNAMLQIQRVCLDGNFDDKTAEKGFTDLLTEQVSVPDLKTLKAELAESQKTVRQIFMKLLSR